MGVFFQPKRIHFLSSYTPLNHTVLSKLILIYFILEEKFHPNNLVYQSQFLLVNFQYLHKTDKCLNIFQRLNLTSLTNF